VTQQQNLAKEMRAHAETVSPDSAVLSNFRDQIHQSRREAHRLAKDAHRFAKAARGNARNEARHQEKEFRRIMKSHSKQLKADIKLTKKQCRSMSSWSSGSDSESDLDSGSNSESEMNHEPEMREKGLDNSRNQPYTRNPSSFTAPIRVPYSEDLEGFHSMGFTGRDPWILEELRKNNGDVNAVLDQLIEK